LENVSNLQAWYTSTSKKKNNGHVNLVHNDEAYNSPCVSVLEECGENINTYVLKTDKPTYLCLNQSPHFIARLLGSFRTGGLIDLIQ